MASLLHKSRLDLHEQLARIDKTQAQLQQIMQDTRLATPQTFFQGALAMATLIGAGAALAKLLL